MLSADVRKIKKKTPQLRLTSPKEAEREFNLTWQGYEGSKMLAELIEDDKSINKVREDRENVLRELEYLW